MLHYRENGSRWSLRSKRTQTPISKQKNKQVSKQANKQTNTEKHTHRGLMSLPCFSSDPRTNQRLL